MRRFRIFTSCFASSSSGVSRIARTRSTILRLRSSDAPQKEVVLHPLFHYNYRKSYLITHNNGSNIIYDATPTEIELQQVQFLFWRRRQIGSSVCVLRFLTHVLFSSYMQRSITKKLTKVNGKTYKEYQTAKYEFYNRVIGIQ